MQTKKFQKGIKIENDTYYIYEGERLDVYLSDTVRSENKEYLAHTIAAGDHIDVGFLIKDVKNVTLDFGGATIVFHGRIVPFVLDGCENFTLTNCKIDYDRPFYTQAHVLDVKPGEVKVKIDDGFDYYVKDGYLTVRSETWEKKLNERDCLLWLYDRSNVKGYPIILGLFGEEIFPNPNPPLPIRQISVEENADETLTFKGDFPPEWDYNDGNNSLVWTHEVRDKGTLNVYGCKNTTIKDVILVYGAAMALTCSRSTNLYVDNFSMFVDYEGNGRLVSNNADAIHTFNCDGEIIIKNCTMEGLLDDTVNVHNNYFSVKSANGKELVAYSRAAGLGFYLECFLKGQRIAVFRGSTQELKGEYTIESIKRNVEDKSFTFTLDRPCENLELNDIIENLSAQPEITIENCRFDKFRGTMRLQSRGKTVVRNCVFANKGTSMLFTGDTNYWYESSPVRDVTFENCEFHNADLWSRICWDSYFTPTEKEKYYHKNITVKNCYFDGPYCASFKNVDGFNFVNNRAKDGVKMQIEVCDSINLNIENAEVKHVE